MLLAIIISFSGCISSEWIPYFGCRPYQGERPEDYPPARWASEMPDLWFDVKSPYEDATKVVEMEGQLVVGEQSVEVIVSFGYTDEIIIRQKEDKGDPCVLTGTCEFSPEKLIVTVEKETDSLLNGQYETITFVRNASMEQTSSQALKGSNRILTNAVVSGRRYLPVDSIFFSK